MYPIYFIFEKSQLLKILRQPPINISLCTRKFGAQQSCNFRYRFFSFYVLPRTKSAQPNLEFHLFSYSERQIHSKRHIKKFIYRVLRKFMSHIWLPNLGFSIVNEKHILENVKGCLCIEFEENNKSRFWDPHFWYKQFWKKFTSNRELRCGFYRTEIEEE